MTTDITITDHGSIILVTPITDQAKAWVDDNVSEESQWFGNSLVVEPRYISNLVDGMSDAGLELAS